VVSNSEDGFIALIDWLSKHIKSTAPEYHFVMEATGVYHERCAEWSTREIGAWTLSASQVFLPQDVHKFTCSLIY
jgi:hypothetical protein